MPPRIITNITDFSDDILLNIFSKLTSYDLLNVLKTCLRFSEIAVDHSLWKKANFQDGCLSAAQVCRYVLPCLHSTTSYICLKGHRRKNFKHVKDLITPNILKSIAKKCKALQEICVTDAIVNARKVKLENFEELTEIKTLSFVKSEFVCLPSPTTEGSYFKNMSTYLPGLENLEVSYSNWITDFDLMVLSKLDNLKSLILKCDLRIGFTTAYLAISFRFGFKSLEELDLRGTSLQNSDVPSVVQSGRLKVLKLGPVGRVKRLTNDLERGLGLVIPDPYRRVEPQQQIVVINMNPNGPRWRHANDEDLEEMGLQWVKRELNKNRCSENDQEPFFFGKEGRIEMNKDSKGEASDIPSIDKPSTSATNQSKKRKDLEGDGSYPSKRQCRTLDSDNSEDEVYEEADFPLLPTEEKNIPDEGLSDLMVPLFRDHTKIINTLVVNGCSITDKGLSELVKHLPLLKYIDVSNTLVTSVGIQQALIFLPQCHFIDNIPLENR